MKRLLLMFFSVALIFFACNADPPVKIKFADVQYEQSETVIDLFSLEFMTMAIVPYVEHSYCTWSGGTLMIGYTSSVAISNSFRNDFINNYENLINRCQAHIVVKSIEVIHRINEVARSGTYLVKNIT